MAEYTLVSHAQFSPTWCAGCQTHAGPFIDTHLEQMQIATALGVQVFEGHIYICTSCAKQMGVLSGCADPEQYSQLMGELLALQEHIEVLEAELHIERDNKIVNRADFGKWMGQQIATTNAVATQEVPAPSPPKRGPGRPRKNPDA